VVQGETGQIVHETPIFKVTGAKWTRGVAQVVELGISQKKSSKWLINVKVLHFIHSQLIQISGICQ
jgi:hypothetical protein